jgi:hypothetical protein
VKRTGRGESMHRSNTRKLSVFQTSKNVVSFVFSFTKSENKKKEVGGRGANWYRWERGWLRKG